MSASEPRRVLLVEDDDGLRAALTRTLDQAGYVVTATSSAEEAWEAHRAFHFPAAVVDWMLPAASGLELAAWIRGRPNGDGVAIVILTGHGSSADLEAVLDIGATDYLIKPVDPEQLTSRLRIARRHVEELQRRRAVELALRKSEANYLALLSALPDWVVRLDGECRVLDAYPDAERFGLKLERGRSLRELLPPHLGRPLEAACYRAQRGEPLEPLEHRLETGGRAIDVEVRVVASADREVVAIVRDVTEVKQAQARLLLAQVIQAKETEHLKISRELHDHVGQMLTVMKMECDWLLQRSSDPEQVRQSVAAMTEKIDQTAAGVRNLAYGLRPAMLDDLGLGAALVALAKEMRARSGMELDVEVGELPEGLDGERAITLYRIAQEALTNVIRHAGAKRARIQVQEDGGFVELTVEDDGGGIPARRLADIRSLGLAGMRERAALVGGSLELSSGPERGTAVKARIPAGVRAKRKGVQVR